MKKSLLLLIAAAFIFIVCSTTRTSLTAHNHNDETVDYFALSKSLNQNIEYEASIKDEKNLVVEFDYNKDATIPKDSPVVKAKVYLYLDTDVVRIYDQTIYQTYEDYLKPVKLTFDADGKEFNRYEIAYEVN